MPGLGAPAKIELAMSTMKVNLTAAVKAAG